MKEPSIKNHELQAETADTFTWREVNVHKLRCQLCHSGYTCMAGQCMAIELEQRQALLSTESTGS